jgi:hypothetical protein
MEAHQTLILPDHPSKTLTDKASPLGIPTVLLTEPGVAPCGLPLALSSDPSSHVLNKKSECSVVIISW